MEYIDNPLDDAEAIYRVNAGVYPVPVEIAVVIDRGRRSSPSWTRPAA